jgi:hypothetical protein
VTSTLFLITPALSQTVLSLCQVRREILCSLHLHSPFVTDCIVIFLLRKRVVLFLHTICGNVFTISQLYFSYLRKRVAAEHIRNKREMLDLMLRRFRWLIGPNSQLSLENKVLIYKTVLQSAWNYGSKILSSSAKSNIRSIEMFLHKYLRTITGAPWYVTTNLELRLDLRVESTITIIQDRIHRYTKRLHRHPNTETRLLLLYTSANTRRLQRIIIIIIIIIIKKKQKN